MIQSNWHLRIGMLLFSLRKLGTRFAIFAVRMFVQIISFDRIFFISKDTNIWMEIKSLLLIKLSGWEEHEKEVAYDLHRCGRLSDSSPESRFSSGIK